MIYQVCVRDGLKEKLNTDIYGKIQQLQSEKNEEVSLKDLQEIYKIYKLKHSYF